MSDLISRQETLNAINTWDKFGADERNRVVRWHEGLETYIHLRDVVHAIANMPSAEPETAKRIVGCARNGMTMWYQCDMCHEPVDEKDAFCRGCGRRFENE